MISLNLSLVPLTFCSGCGYAHNGFNQCDAVTGRAGPDKSDLAGAEAEFGKGHGGVDGVGWVALFYLFRSRMSRVGTGIPPSVGM